MPYIFAPLEVLVDSRLTDRERRVLLSLFSFRGKNTNIVWPSLVKIAERANISDLPMVSKITTSLAKKGWLTKRKRGFTGCNQYDLTVPDLEESTNLAKSTKLDESTNLAKSTNSNLAKSTNSNLAKSTKYKEQTNEQTNEEKKKIIKKRKFPNDFLLTGILKERALKYWSDKNRSDLDPVDEFDKFRAHHVSHGTTMLDWDAAWQTWYSNAPKFNKPPYGVSSYLSEDAPIWN